MIVFSASMPKSGSAWLQSITRDLLREAGLDDIANLRERYDLDKLIQTRNGKIPDLAAGTLDRLLDLHLRGHTFAVKTHNAPTLSLQSLVKGGVARTTYIYRDPRDAMLSALEHGARLRGRGEDGGPFTHMKRPEDAARAWISNWLPVWMRWTRFPGAFVVRYEDMVDDVMAVTRSVDRHLGLSHPEGVLRSVVERNSMSAIKRDSDAASRMHVNKGRVGRHREVFSRVEMRTYTEAMRPWLRAMGYDTDLPKEAGPGLAHHIKVTEDEAFAAQALATMPDAEAPVAVE